MATNNSIQVTYSDDRLRTLVEEFITMQKHDFTFKALGSYVLFWAKEEGNTANTGLYESDLLAPSDCERICAILRKIIKEGLISRRTDAFTNDTLLVKEKEK